MHWRIYTSRCTSADVNRRWYICACVRMRKCTSSRQNLTSRCDCRRYRHTRSIQTLTLDKSCCFFSITTTVRHYSIQQLKKKQERKETNKQKWQKTRATQICAYMSKSTQLYRLRTDSQKKIRVHLHLMQIHCNPSKAVNDISSSNCFLPFFWNMLTSQANCIYWHMKTITITTKSKPVFKRNENVITL